MKGFYELFSLLKKQKGPSSLKCLIINTRANRVVIVSSVITKIFSLYANVGRSHFNLFNKDTRDLFMLWIMLVASYCCLLLLLLFDYLFILVRLLFSVSFNYFVWFYFIVQFSCSLVNIQFWSWIVFQVFWSRWTSSSSKSINIIQQTAPSLS
jgi:hypothetical protein